MTSKRSFVMRIRKAVNRNDPAAPGGKYYIWTAYLPREVAEDLQCLPEDYLFLTAQRAEWYHFIDWSKSPASWERLPKEVKDSIIASGLPYPQDPDQDKLDDQIPEA